VAIVGGLIVFGPSGLILGPVTLAVTVLLLEIWQERTHEATSVVGARGTRGHLGE
jgi:predicted PurR-regulated permease PerM